MLENFRAALHNAWSKPTGEHQTPIIDSSLVGLPENALTHKYPRNGPAVGMACNPLDPLQVQLNSRAGHGLIHCGPPKRRDYA